MCGELVELAEREPMTIDVVLGKKNRPLRFDMSAIQAAERTLDKPIFSALRDVHNMSSVAIVTLLWAGMRHAEPNQTPARVATLLESYLEADGELSTIIRAIDEALSASVWFRSMLKDEDTGEAKPEKKDGSPNGS